jgi:hypothetical protein
MLKIKINLTLITVVLLQLTAFAHSADSTANAEKELVKVKVASFFEAMYNNDSTTLKQLFDEDARLLIVLSQGQVASLLEQDVKAFIADVGMPKTELWKEVAWSYTIEVEAEMASVWCPYTFFLETNGTKQLMHCGVNSFELYRGPIGWQITQITDIRSLGNCRAE